MSFFADLFNLLVYVINSFFRDGLWIVVFFFLLNKTIKHRVLKKISIYIMSACFFILIVYYFMSGL